MKTVSGSITSSKRISLSKAAAVLSNFISAETGASQAVSVYLKRASDSFNELVQFHREIKAGRSERKHKSSRLEVVDIESLRGAETNPRVDGPALERGRILDLGEEQSYGYRRNSEGGGFDDEGMNSLGKKKKKSDFSDHGPEAEAGEDGGGMEIEEKRKEIKKRKMEEVVHEGLDDSEERHSRKKRKKKKKRRSEGE